MLKDWNKYKGSYNGFQNIALLYQVFFFGEPNTKLTTILCNQYLWPLTLWVRISLRRYNIMWKRSVVFSGYSSANKTDCHDITEILLKVALNTINQTKPYWHNWSFYLVNTWIQILPLSKWKHYTSDISEAPIIKRMKSVLYVSGINHRNHFLKIDKKVEIFVSQMSIKYPMKFDLVLLIWTFLFLQYVDCIWYTQYVNMLHIWRDNW